MIKSDFFTRAFTSGQVNKSGSEKIDPSRRRACHQSVVGSNRFLIDKRNIILFLIIFFLISCSPINTENENIKKVCFDDNCFSVELAITDDEKRTGLMHRKYLEKDKGMLFIYQSEKISSFWMKNTLIPLDIIWIDNNNQVIDITKNIPPCNTSSCPSYSPKSPAKYVLEINSGLLENSIDIGDIAEFA